MKIGIITYHKAYNYGSALQAYALNNYLNQINNVRAETINYVTQRQTQIYGLFEPVKSILSIARNVHTLMNVRKLVLHKKRFDEFVNNEIVLSKDVFNSSEDLMKISDSYEYYMCGSDQIWNPNTVDFDESYMLSFVDDKSKCIAYAPSIGVSKIKEEHKHYYLENLPNFHRLSVREKSGADIAKEIIGREVKVVLDPVFLLTENQWTNMAKCDIKCPYVLGYFIGAISGMRDFANRMHKETGLPVVVIYKNLRDMKYRFSNHYDAGPREFVGLVQNAKYVVTNSFHAVAFSLISKKNFWAFTDTSNPNAPHSRIENILEDFQLTNRIINKETMSEIDYREPILYKRNFEELIERKRQDSIDYILESLGLKK